MDLEELRKLVKDGKSNKEIAEKFDAPIGLIKKILAKNNIRREKKLSSKKDINSIISDYLSLMTLPELAKKYKCDRELIINRLKTNNIELRNDLKTYLSEEDEKNIIAIYENESIADIALKYKIGYHTIIDIFKKYNIKVKHWVKLSEDQINELIKDYPILDTASMEEKYNISIKSIYKILKENNVDFKTNHSFLYHKLHNKEIEYFKDIKTKNEAYFLGLLMADGNVFIDKRTDRMSIGLHPDDKYLLQIFSYLLAGKDIVRKEVSRNICTLAINNSSIVKNLTEYGCVPNKTYCADLPKKLEKGFIKYFILGLFDGDGTISKTFEKTGKPRFRYGFSITGHIDLLKKVQKFIKDELNIKTSIYKTASSENGIYSLDLNRRYEIYKLMSYLYRGATVYMLRKYDRYLELEKTLDFNSNKYKKVFGNK